MDVYHDNVLQILVDQQYISSDDLKSARLYAREHNARAMDFLLREEFVNNAIIGQAIAEHFGLPFYDLSRFEDKETYKFFTEDFARKNRVVFVEEKGKKDVIVATDEPDVKGLLPALKKKLGKKKLVLHYSMTDDIDRVLRGYQKPLAERFARVLQKQEHVAADLLHEILVEAFSVHASDIHFEPQGEYVIIRLRIDGALRKVGELPQPFYLKLISRIKVVAGLRIDQHYSMQDGSMTYQSGGKSFDLRISIVPTIYGEKTVLRVLGSYIQSLHLTELGVSEEGQETFLEAVHKPFGMVIVIGPTGSGKTTTLYALLREVNDVESNITTIEDPVEYKLHGINQIQVDPERDITFASGLRSVVRQDPDIILVGEIRDEETAEIAVNAALTGHMVLSTFHANDAATAIPRILDMGVEAFLLSSTVELLVAQRLARKICSACRVSYDVDVKKVVKEHPYTKQYYKKTGKVRMYKGKGCPTCNHSGYHGRTSVFEYIRITEEMRELILSHPSSQDIWKLARTQGAVALFDDGMEKVRSGVITIDELLRIAKPPTY